MSDSSLETAEEFAGWDAQFRLCLLLIASFAAASFLLCLWLAWALMTLVPA